MRRIVLLCLVWAAPSAAQIGYPYPPRYPGVPGSPGQQQPGQRRTRRTEKREAAEKEAAKTVSATGKITAIRDKTWTIYADDTRYLEVKVNDKTQFARDGKDVKLDALSVGDRVRLEATPDTEEILTATRIEAVKAEAVKVEAAPEGEAVTEMEVKPQESQKQAQMPAPADPDDPGRPRLARGIPPRLPAPKAVEQAAPAAESQAPKSSATARSQPEPGADPLLQRARAVAMAFTESLPNFEVQQLTTRYQSAESGRNWKAQDTVTSDVTYRAGKEDYKNIKINNRLVNKDMMDIPGARSTGEFGTTLVSLFSPASHTEFKKLRDTTISNRSAVSYSYVVQRPHSDYRIFWGSQYIVPAYSGRVWIDKDTARVLRIEIQADNIPAEFPLDKVEAAIDYGPERMGSESYIVPLSAENLSCLRGTAFCGKNAIEWRNYRLYKGEATITFEAK